MARIRDVGIDVVHAGKDGTRKVSNLARCPQCTDRFRASDAVIRVRDYSADGIPEITIHRRCMERLLLASVEDEPIALTKFEAYRLEVAEKHGLAIG